MAEGIWRIRGMWVALSVQHREIAEEEGIVRERGRKLYLEVWENIGTTRVSGCF